MIQFKEREKKKIDFGLSFYHKISEAKPQTLELYRKLTIAEKNPKDPSVHNTWFNPLHSEAVGVRVPMIVNWRVIRLAKCLF